MESSVLLNILERYLGTSKQTAKGNHSFHCPNCNHHKPKLEINLNTHSWNCWVCGNRDNFKGKTIKSLFKRINVDIKNIPDLKYISKPSKKVVPNKDNIEKIQLPPEFISLKNISKKNILGRHALNYLKSRGLSDDDITKYNLGICEIGKYKEMLIIPSYDENGILNYFTSKGFMEYNEKVKVNPPFSRDIIGFEIFINWNKPIILVEGPFDAMTVKRNVIPLFGKVILPELEKKIIKSNVNKIYIALDEDAHKESLKHCEHFMNNGKEVYLVDIKDKDFNELGFEESLKVLHNSHPLTFKDLITQKMNLW
jgi:transcription elongation factor Elf1